MADAVAVDVAAVTQIKAKPSRAGQNNKKKTGKPSFQLVQDIAEKTVINKTWAEKRRSLNSSVNLDHN